MYNDDYIMLFDENGQPYIEHASLAGIRTAVTGAVRSGVSKLKGMRRPGAKYYARIDDPKRPGDYLYFYSKEEYDRYRENQTRSRTADRELQRLERAVKANPSPKNKAALLSKREEINNAKRQAEESENAARKRSYDVSVGKAIDDTKSNLQSAKSTVGNKVNQAKNTIERMKNDLKKKAGVGAKAAYDKEQKEADEANARYDRILQGYRDARARGDKESEERLGRTLRLYDETRSREEREAREAKAEYDDTWAGKVNSAANKAKKAVTNAYDKLDDIPENARNKAQEVSGNIRNKGQELSENIKNTVGIGLKDKAAKEQKEANEANARYNTMLEGYRNAFNTGDKAAEEHLGKRLREYGNDRDREEREARDAENAYNNSWAGKADKALKAIKDGSKSIKDMSTEQLSKLADDLKSAPSKTREYIDSGREAIKNTTGIGLRETYNTAQQKLNRAEDVMDQVEAELRTAVANGDTDRTKELYRTQRNLSETIREYRKEVEAASNAYNNSWAGKVEKNKSNTSSNATESQPSEATIQKLLDKFNAKEKLSTKEMNIIMSFLGGIFNS